MNHDNSGTSSEGVKSLSLLHKLVLTKVMFWVIVLAWMGFDLATKSWAESYLTTERYFYKGQTTPKLVHDDFKHSNEGVVGIEGALNYKWAENYGAAFSIGGGSGSPLPFIVLSIGVLGIIFYYVATTPPKHRFTLFCLALITGGALGNLHDRIFHKTIDTRYVGPGQPIESFGEETTAVRDFLYWPFDIPLYSTWGLEEDEPTRKWPVFNIADVGIVGGVIGLSGVFLFVPGAGRKEEEDEKSESPTSSSQGTS